jgi:hypothetical protein
VLKSLTLAAAALSVLCGVATATQAEDRHVVTHHTKRVCTMHHHHRVCVTKHW